MVHALNLGRMKTKLLYIIELDEWLPSYPGDPLVRPATYSIEFVTDNVPELDKWMTDMCKSKFIKKSDEQIRVSTGLHNLVEGDPIDQWVVIYEFIEKKDFMIVKLAWHGL